MTVQATPVQAKREEFERLVKNIGQQWKAKGDNSGYVRDFHYRDTPTGSVFPDAFFGYQNQHNAKAGVVNSDTHWHVYVNLTGHFMMRLKCKDKVPIREEVPFDVRDSDLVNKIDKGLTSCWETSKSKGKGGRRKSKRINRINRINKKQSSNRRNKTKRTNKRR
jgi:hypothetical protein